MASQRVTRRKAASSESNVPKKRPRRPTARYQQDANASSSAKRGSRKRGRPPVHTQLPDEPEEPEEQATNVRPSKKSNKLISRAESSKQQEEETTGTSYFESHRGTVRTSNLTLASLNILPAAVLEKARQDLVDPLADEQQQQLESLQTQFPEFAYILGAGHSLLFHGYGSKKVLLDEFASYLASYSSVIVVNGFNPTLSLRTVLQQITGDILQLQSGHGKRTLLDYVEGIREGIGRNKVAIVIHNIDGPSLRVQEAQVALAALSSVNNITLVASVDHLNAPLLWDGAIYSQFSWAWIQANTFVPYDAETVFCSKPLLRGGDERQVEGAIALLKSLSDRARKVFRELANRQTGGAALRDDDGSSDNEAQQIRTTFNELFEISKEHFLASDPASLQVILTELQTHHLLECRRGADAASQLWIPLQLSQLRDIIKAIDSSSE